MRLALTSVGLALLFAPVAAAQSPATGSATVTPNVAGKGSRVTVTASGGTAASGARPPRSVVLAVQRGFRFDRRARAKSCTAAQAASFTCPEKSRVGRGTAVAGVTAPFIGARDVTAAIDVFLGRRAAGELAGLVVQVSEPSTGRRGTARGRVVRVPTGPFGLEVRFDALPAPMSLPPGVTVTLKSLRVTVGASRKVRVRRRVNGRRVTRRVRRRLIRNPKSCSGTWAYQVRLGFDTGPQTFDRRVDCTPAPDTG